MTDATRIDPVKDGTPLERSEYWRVVDGDAATAFAALRETGSACIRFGSIAPDVMRAVDRLCRTSRLDVKVAKRGDIGLDYYLPEAWAEVAEQQRRDRQNHPHGLWDVVRSLRDRVAA
ncbi:MAG: hypothetical protein ABI317_03905 [Gaiellales bacterium]